MSKRNTIDYVCYNQDCKHNDKCFCQLKGVKPNGCINAISKQGYELCIGLKAEKITDLENQLALTEKALELACKELRDISCMQCNSCNRFEMCDYVLSTYPSSCFIEEAKEMMKSE